MTLIQENAKRIIEELVKKSELFSRPPRRKRYIKRDLYF